VWDSEPRADGVACVIVCQATAAANQSLSYHHDFIATAADGVHQVDLSKEQAGARIEQQPCDAAGEGGPPPTILDLAVPCHEVLLAPGDQQPAAAGGDPMGNAGSMTRDPSGLGGKEMTTGPHAATGAVAVADNLVLIPRRTGDAVQPVS